jgi:hypothetical protein
MIFSPCSGIFKNIIGFDGDSLFPHQTSTFLMKLCQKVFSSLSSCKLLRTIVQVFVEKFTLEIILPALLREEEALGAHTSVFNLSASVGQRYTWYHPQVKPMGVALDLQCETCGRLRSLEVAYDDESVTVSCAHPQCKSTFNIPPSQWRVKRMKTSHRAEWGCETLW